MKVKVRGVIVHDGKLVIARERRRGREHLSIPGGRVRDGESITEALVREVAEETGIDVVPERLLYVAELVGSYGVHELILVWRAEPRDPTVVIDASACVAFDSPEARSTMPPIVAQIAADAPPAGPLSHGGSATSADPRAEIMVTARMGPRRQLSVTHAATHTPGAETTRCTTGPRDVRPALPVHIHGDRATDHPVATSPRG